MSRESRASPSGVHLAIIACALVIVVSVHASHGLPFNWDDQGQYLSHARAVLDGRPYTDIGFIYTNYNNYIGPIAEPPGLPLLIAPALAISGPELIPVRGVLVVALAVLVAFAWVFARELSERWTATAVAVFVIAFFSQQHAFDGVLADLPFGAAIWCVILAANTPAPLSRTRLLTMAIAGALAFTFRMAALALLPAIAMMIALRPRPERLGLGLVGATWMIVAGLVMFAMPTSSALATETARANVLADMSINLSVLRHSVQEGFLYPFPWSPANAVFQVTALVMAALGAWSMVRTQPRRFANLLAISYVAMLVVLPTRATRYWWPLVPLQALALFEGMSLLLRARRGVSRWIAPAAATLLLIATLTRSRREPATPMFERADIRQVADTIRALAREQPARVSYFSPRTFTWHTGMPAMGHFAANPDETLAELRDKRIEFVVLGSLGESEIHDASMSRAIAERSAGFEFLASISAFKVYRVVP